MTSDRFFSSVRFVNVCKKDLLESWKANLLRFAMLYAVLTFFFVLSYFKESLNSVIFPSVFIFVAMGCMYASSVMEKMSTKEKRMAYLMLPATSFEKYLSRLLYSLVFYTVAFVVAFKLADFTGMAVWACFHPAESIPVFPMSFHEFSTISFGSSMGKWNIYDNIYQYLFLHSCFVLGGNIWYKRPFPKTIVALLAMLVIFIFVFSWSLELFIGDMHINFSSRTWFNPEVWSQWSKWVLTLVALFNWTLAYYRFKEAEVINRLI